jgi:hypothetical protein
MAISAAGRKSPAFDEVAHLTAGYSYWLTGDYRLHPENGLLPQKWAALPLLYAGERFPPLDQLAWHRSNVWALGYQFFYLVGNDVESTLALGRSMIVVLGVALGMIVYGWSQKLFGPRGALLSLTLYVFNPALLAYGALVTSDLSLALFLFLSVLAVWTLAHRIDLFNLLAAAASVTAALLSKVSSLAIIPIALVVMVLRTRFGPAVAISMGAQRLADKSWARLAATALSLAATAIVVSALLWSIYGLRYSAFASDPAPGTHFYEDWTDLRSDRSVTGASVRWLRDHRILPEAYLYGVAFISKVSPERPAFLNGAVRRGGWWTFFLYAFAVKTPLPLFGLLVLAALAASIRTDRRAPTDPTLPSFYDTIPLWLLVSVYGGLAIGSGLSFGHRYILPIYPALFVLAGAASSWLTRRRAAVGALVLLLSALYVGDSVRSWPNYLAYFNSLAGGSSQGWRHLVDSSLDWGQDLPELKSWLDRNAGSDPVYLSYFGTGRPDHYGIRAERLPSYIAGPGERRPSSLTAGIYCISATMLQSLFSPAFGPWRPSYERIYRQLQDEVEGHDTRAAQSGAVENSLADRFALFDELRFARLCAFLRQRSPDSEAGYSILVYRLTTEEIQEALDGPPAESAPDEE